MITELAEQVKDALEWWNEIWGCISNDFSPRSSLTLSRLANIGPFCTISQEVKYHNQRHKELFKIFGVGPNQRNIDLLFEITQNRLQDQLIADLWMGHFSHVILDKSYWFFDTLCLGVLYSFPVPLLYDPVLFSFQLIKWIGSHIKLNIVFHLWQVKFFQLACRNRFNWL